MTTNYIAGPRGGAAMTLGVARERARAYMREMSGGIDPLLEARKQGATTAQTMAAQKRTFGIVWDEWAQVAGQGGSPRTITTRAGVGKWMLASPLFRTPFATISVQTIDETYRPIFNAVSQQRVDSNGQLIARQPIPLWLPIKSLGPDTALKLYGYAHTAWTYAATLGELKVRDPFEAWRVGNRRMFPDKVKRKRALRFDKDEGSIYVQEVERLRHDENATLACTADYVLLLLLWGTRRMETMRLRWSDIDVSERAIRLRAENVKNGKLHVLPMEPWALEILMARRKTNAVRGLGTGPEDWIFPSRRISTAQAKELKAAKQEDREPAQWASAGVTHISSTINILDRLEARIGRKTSLHDLRRTVAGALTLAKTALEETSKSLNHSPAGNFSQTKDYIPDHDNLALLRSLFAKHETTMRRFAGLETASVLEQGLTPEQQMILDTALKMMQTANVSPEHLRQALGK